MNKLTAKQEEVLREYQQRWIDLEMKNVRADFEQCIRWALEAYKAAGEKAPTRFYMVDSPISAAALIEELTLFEAGHKDGVNHTPGRVRYADPMKRNAELNAKGHNPRRHISNMNFASVDACYWGWQDFLVNETKEPVSPTIRAIMELSRYCSWFSAHETTVVFQDRALEIHLDGERRLHCTTGPALAYADGWKAWALHGVRCEQWIVETPAEEMDPKRLFEITNAQVRAEFVRKVGIERLVAKMGAKTVDTWTSEKRPDNKYDLINFNPDGRDRHYLRMNNLSVPDLIHLEGVPNTCTTVLEALAWRDGEEVYQEPDILT